MTSHGDEVGDKVVLFARFAGFVREMSLQRCQEMS